MNQLQIDVSFNYNNSIEITSNISYNLDKINTKNKFLFCDGFNLKVDNNQLIEETEGIIPIKFKLDNSEVTKNINYKLSCENKSVDSSENILKLNFLQKYFTDKEKLNNDIERIPKEISSKYNILEYDLENESELPEEILKWKRNMFPLEEDIKFKINDNLYLYIWILPYFFNILNTGNYNSQNLLIFIGEEHNISEFNLKQIISDYNLKKYIQRNLQVNVEKMYK